jgi:type VI secretion system protein ImpK
MTVPEESAQARPARASGGRRLIDAFREVHAEVVRNARALAAPEPPDHEAVRQRLLAVLTRQANDARDRLADHELTEFEEAQYVMVAMADELLLHLDWPGRDEWARRPLEAEAHFGTHVAGERVFNRLEEVLAGRASASGELLVVYLALLSFGFRGRYRFDPTSTEPARFRRELMKHLRRIEPRMVAPSGELCPEALENVRDKEPRRGLTGLREGMIPLVAVAFAMLLIGHALWYYRTTEVRGKLDRIEEEHEAREKALKVAAQKRALEADGGAP